MLAPLLCLGHLDKEIDMELVILALCAIPARFIGHLIARMLGL